MMKNHFLSAIVAMSLYLSVSAITASAHANETVNKASPTPVVQSPTNIATVQSPAESKALIAKGMQDSLETLAILANDNRMIADNAIICSVIQNPDKTLGMEVSYTISQSCIEGSGLQMTRAATLGDSFKVGQYASILKRTDGSLLAISKN